jgi:homoserine kinase
MLIMWLCPLGGFTLVRSYDHWILLESIVLRTCMQPWFTLKWIKTSDARSVLKQTISLKRHRSNGNVGGLIAGFTLGLRLDRPLATRRNCREPLRSVWFRFWFNQTNGYGKRRLGSGISGSGPSIFCFKQRRSHRQCNC